MASKKEKTEELFSGMTDLFTQMSTQMSKKNQKEKMQTLQNMSFNLRKGGNIKKAKDLQHAVKEQQKAEREANEETAKLIQIEHFQRMVGIPEEHRTDDGDQTPVHGHFEVSKLKAMWAGGMNWNPNNPLSSPWLLALAAGDYDGMMQIIKETPQSEIKDLIEKRETLVNIPALFHIVKGASMMTNNQNRFDSSNTFCNRSKTPRHIKCLTKIIELGGNVNARDFAGFTPLHLCVTCYGNSTTLKMAKILLENGANPNAQNRFGETALIQPMLTKELDCVRLLLDYGVDPAIKDNLGMTAVNMNVMDNDFNLLFINARQKKAKKIREEALKVNGGILSCEACNNPSLRRCTGCYVARYCSKDCQVSHWKSHKKICGENKNRFVAVQLDNTLFAANISWIQGGKFTTVDGNNKKPKTIFMVKIQVPRRADVDVRGMKLKPTEDALLLYDQHKDVYGSITCDDAAYHPLRKLVEEKGLDGLKGYFDAIFDKDGCLRVNIKDIKLPQNW